VNETEWRGTLTTINDDIRHIIRNQRVLRDVTRQLDARDQRPLEEDFIDADLHDVRPGSATIREVDGVQIVIRKLHRRGASSGDIRGADLLYEIENEKYVLIQYKTPDSRGRVAKDEEQMAILKDSCSSPCQPTSSVLPFCGSWYAVRSLAGTVYHPVCLAEQIFGPAGSRYATAFSRGLSRETFDELFARCWIGARTRPLDISYLVWSLFNADHFLVTAFQRGRFV